jgi:hypothetical protein
MRRRRAEASLCSALRARSLWSCGRDARGGAPRLQEQGVRQAAWRRRRSRCAAGGMEETEVNVYSGGVKERPVAS